MNATNTDVEGGQDTLIAFPKQLATVIETATVATPKNHGAAAR